MPRACCSRRCVAGEMPAELIVNVFEISLNNLKKSLVFFLIQSKKNCEGIKKFFEIQTIWKTYART